MVENLSSNIILSKKQRFDLYYFIQELIEDLPDKALNELMSGYGNDVDKLFDSISREAYRVLYTNIGDGVNSEATCYLENLQKSFSETLKRVNYNYFKATMLSDFNMGWRNIEWGNLIQNIKYINIKASRGSGKSYETCFAFPLWRLYRYYRPSLYQKQTLDNRNSKETVLITNELSLAKKHLSKIVDEIKGNELFHEILLPKVVSDLGKDKLVAKNGATVELRSKDSTIRGLHVGGVVVDDFLDKSALYSREQREKFEEVFYAEIVNIVEPKGYLVVAGCVSPNTIVTTNSGLRYIGDMCPIGDYKKEKQMLPFKELVLGRSGFNETSHYWCNSESNNYNIVTKFGYNLNGSNIHPILILDSDGKMKWKKMPELKLGDHVCLRAGQGFGDANFIDCSSFVGSSRVNTNKITVGETLDVDWLYFFGLCIADGSFDKTKTGFTIVKSNKGIRDFVLSGFNGTKFKERNNDQIKMDFSSVELKRLFDLVGCEIATALNKKVPKKIFESNKESLKYFLQGLFDGDGCFYSDKSGYNQINLSSISKELINQVQVILLHFGVCSSVKNKGIIISEKVEGKHDLYSLNITGYDVSIFMEEIGFRFSSKGKDYKDSSFEKSSEFRLVPFQASIFKNIRKEKSRINRGNKIRKINSPQSMYNKYSSKSNLKECLKYFIDNGAVGENVELAKENLYNDFIYLPIENISQNKGWTVDFVIPNDHTFLSNGIISHNTPFHVKDLYGRISEDKNFKSFVYPGIYENGDLLAPDRHTLKYVLDLKESLGSIVFSREVLVNPISDASSLFPYEWLHRSLIGMDNVRYVENIESYPNHIKFEKIVTACDFAFSGNIGADSSAFVTVGRATDKKFYLINIWRGQGISHNEQISQIVSIRHRFKPNEVVAEDNAAQTVMVGLLKDRGVDNVVPFTTTASIKKDLYVGLPSLSALFERGDIKCPYGDEKSKTMTDLMFSEFNSVTFNEDNGKLENVNGHDDIAMAVFMAITKLREVGNELKIHIM